MTRASRFLGGLLALATGAALWGAGSGGRLAEVDQDAVSAQRMARSLACVTGLDGGRAVVGTLRGEVTGDLPIRRGIVDLVKKAPGFTVRAGVGAAATTYASQWAKAGRWYAAQPCAEPSRQQWFLGAGASRLHQSTLTVANTRSGEAVFDVRVFGPEGEVEAPGLRGLSVQDRPMRLDLAEVAPSVDDLAVSVTAIRGLVSASVVDAWAPSAAEKTMTEFLPGQAEAGTDLVIGGLPDRPRQPTLSVFNPGENAAVIEVRLIGEDGTFEPARAEPVTAPPGQLTQVPVPSAGRQGASGLHLTSSEPVLAGVRALDDGDVVQTAGLGALGEAAIVGVPDRSRGVLHLFNPDPEQAIGGRVQFHGVDGKVVADRRIEVQPGTTVAITPGPLRGIKVRAVRILAGGELRGVLSVDDGGMAVLPVQSVTGETRVPAVRPRG